MTVALPTGLGLTLGMAEESTPGTATTTGMRWFSPHPGETLANKKNTAQSKALYGGLSLRDDRRVLVYSESAGKIELDLMEKTMGLIWRHITGSSATAVQQGATAAYLQQHPWNNTTSLLGRSLTVQKGMPESPDASTPGTVQPFTYGGVKIEDFEITCKVGEFAQIALTLDGMKGEDTSTSFAAPSFVTGNKIMHFGEGALLLGGTPTTSSGIVSISGGTAPTGLVSEVSVKGTRKFNKKRVNIGASSKKEQVDNDFFELVVSFTCEFATLEDYKSSELTDARTAIEIDFTDPTAIASTYHPYTKIIIPNAVITDAPTTAADMDVIKAKVTADARYDGTNPLFEIDYMSTDTAV